MCEILTHLCGHRLMQTRVNVFPLFVCADVRLMCLCENFSRYVGTHRLVRGSNVWALANALTL